MIETFFKGRIFIKLLGSILLCHLFVSAQNKPANKLVFADEFNGVSGSSIDLTKWTMQTGGNGWGNKELQYYTDSRENTYQDGKGSLVIKTIKQALPLSYKCWYGQCKYTSARLMTRNKFDQKYGRFEARIKIPRGIGIWPAFWMLGNDIDKLGWPQCGEIDIMENIGREPSTIHGTIHGPGYSGSNGVGAPYSLIKNKVFADDFHVYSAAWRENQINFYVDTHLYKTITPKDLPGRWVYDHPFFMILNLAIGGAWSGAPDDATTFPQTMIVDYVRVYSE
jgi:beta-glucanase (GH16 family)